MCTVTSVSLLTKVNSKILTLLSLLLLSASSSTTSTSVCWLLKVNDLVS